jgi:hypothetical protein
MPLIVPYASVPSDAAAQILRDLALPHLRRLLARAEPADLSPHAPTESDAWSFTPPHEAAWAQLNGWQGSDGCWPFAAWHAQLDGLLDGSSGGTEAWGELTPVHWVAGRDHVKLASPQDLQLGEAESRALYAAVEPLFTEEGLRLAWGAPLRWYVVGSDLDGLRTASLDRVIGRNIDPWLPYDAAARRLRRMQQEVQMLLYQHPLHDERVARGALPVNSVWLSGCGRPQAVRPATQGAAPVTVDDRLRAAALAEDWQAWSEAWQALDEQVLGRWDERSDGADSLVLCGERRWRLVSPRARATLGQRLQQWWSPIEPAQALADL